MYKLELQEHEKKKTTYNGNFMSFHDTREADLDERSVLRVGGKRGIEIRMPIRCANK
jgi:hypothetical protein